MPHMGLQQQHMMDDFSSESGSNDAGSFIDTTTG
jgi:hypothetical protein